LHGLIYAATSREAYELQVAINLMIAEKNCDCNWGGECGNRFSL
jgi:hypothetical protein